MQYKENWQKLSEKWSHLASRERKMILIGSGFATLFIFYQFLWSPWLNHVVLMRQQIQTNHKLLTWMQSADQTMQKISLNTINNKNTSAVTLLATLQKQTNQFALEKGLTQLKQSTQDSIEMQFQKIEFDQLLRLLLSVTQQQNITISQATIVAENKPGIVNADLVLKF